MTDQVMLKGINVLLTFSTGMRILVSVFGRIHFNLTLKDGMDLKKF